VRVVHSLPGRLRVHLPDWSGTEPVALEQLVAALPGVSEVRVSALTRNVLVRFDEDAADEGQIMRALRGRPRRPRARRAVPRAAAAEQPETRPHVVRRAAGGAVRAPRHVIREVGRFGRRARIAVPGLDCDPRVAHQAVERLSKLKGVSRVTASQLTGRVLVEFSERQIDIEAIVSQLTKLDLPELPGEDAPSHPLDPVPVIQSSARAIGSALGLGLLAGRRALGRPGAPVSGTRAAQVAGAVGIVEGLPPIEQQLERLLGRNGAQVAISSIAIVSLTFAGNPLGLAVTGAGALRLMSAARGRRNGWRAYEQRVGDAEPAHPGAQIELEAGERVPLSGRVSSGFGTGISREGEVIGVAPGTAIDAGTRLAGGPVTVELEVERGFVPHPRATPPTPTMYDRYLRTVPSVSLAFAAFTGLRWRSLGRALTALLLVNPRAAMIGAESADNGAAARVLRHGITVVGSREKRPICRPDALIVEAARAIIDGLEVAEARSLDERRSDDEVLRLAAGISDAAGSPWGDVFRSTQSAEAVDGTFDGETATAEVDGERWLLRSRAGRDRAAVLELRRPGPGSMVGRLELRLRPAPGIEQLIEACRRADVPLLLADRCSGSARELAERTGIEMIGGDALDHIRRLQADGAIVWALSDSAHAAAEFAECDLAIGVSSGRGGRFAARADLLAPDLAGVAAIIDTGTRRDRAVLDSVLASIASNCAGAAWGIGGNPRFERGSYATYVAALVAIGAGYSRLQGGARPRSVTERLSDPQPERYGRLSIGEVLEELDATPGGLTDKQARKRRRPDDSHERTDPLVAAALDQLRSPLTGILAGGAALSLLLGAVGDVAMIAAVIAVNTAVGTWQEREAGRAADALERMSARTANVLRDGQVRRLPVEELVRGDVIMLAAGDRVPADARLLGAEGLEVDESPLTGESVPVEKAASGGVAASRVVLEGSDVTVGTARAVVVAVGSQTRMGATAAAIALHETSESPLGRRLSQMFRQGLPVIVGGGLLVTVSGVLWGQPLVPQLAVGASIALAAVPEGLPLLAGVAQAAVARRLAGRQALVQRLAAVEALGRVDVACADKTGTLTHGRLELTCVADAGELTAAPDALTGPLRRVLEVAAVASPHPDAPALRSHPTDVAVVRAAERAGLSAMRESDREEEPFEPSRGFHATRMGATVFVKGAPETLARRCDRVRLDGSERGLDAAGREALLRRADELSGQGLRVLMVAEGPADASVEDPEGLLAIGYVGISDPLREGVAAAVSRCEAAGVRVVMLTGDHPATAGAIAREAGLSMNGEILTGEQLKALGDDELDRRLETARVIARVTPLDKLRIVEALQRRGHVVAMTGDGVNDAPALRLADVGVAMGLRGTDVARQAADVVLADDDFSTLVETLVEGRGFWHNIRRALGLLLGGNLGELTLMVAAALTGRGSPLNTRQILAINLVTDVLPAIAVAVQEPEHRDLAALAREGTAALDAPLRREVIRRGLATGLPSFGAYALAARTSTPERASAVAFTSAISSQLAQTLELGSAEGRLSREVMAAVGASFAFVAASLTFPPLQRFLGLAVPTPLGLVLCAGASAASVLIGRSHSAEPVFVRK